MIILINHRALQPPGARPASAEARSSALLPLLHRAAGRLGRLGRRHRHRRGDHGRLHATATSVSTLRRGRRRPRAAARKHLGAGHDVLARGGHGVDGNQEARVVGLVRAREADCLGGDGRAGAAGDVDLGAFHLGRG